MSKQNPYTVQLPTSWEESLGILVTLKMRGIDGTYSTGYGELRRMALLADTVASLVESLRSCLAEIDHEIEQRKHSGNNEDWAALSALSDRGHAAIRAVEDAA
jgi:hypothetical protein